MAVASINPPRDYVHAHEILAGKNSKKLGHNTYLALPGLRDVVVILYHGNTIATYTPNGLEVTLAGWDTATTRGRLRQITGVRCGRVKGQTFINDQPVFANQLVEIKATK